MFNIKLIGIFAFTVFVISESAFVEHVMKCGLKDEECHKKLLKSIFTELGENGASEYGITAIDPFYIKKLPMSLPGVMDLDITDASITGHKNCYFEKFKLDMDTKLVDGTLTCPKVVVTGKYEITSSELIKTLLGKDVTGKGLGSIESEKVNIGIHLPFKVVKREDNLYFQPILKSTTYTFEIVGNAKFNADNIKIGDEDVTKMVLDLMNQNAKMITTALENFLSETASKILDDEINLILNGIPMNTVLNDLSE